MTNRYKHNKGREILCSTCQNLILSNGETRIDCQKGYQFRYGSLNSNLLRNDNPSNSTRSVITNQMLKPNCYNCSDYNKIPVEDEDDDWNEYEDEDEDDDWDDYNEEEEKDYD